MITSSRMFQLVLVMALSASAIAAEAEPEASPPSPSTQPATTPQVSVPIGDQLTTTTAPSPTSPPSSAETRSSTASQAPGTTNLQPTASPPSTPVTASSAPPSPSPSIPGPASSSVPQESGTTDLQPTPSPPSTPVKASSAPPSQPPTTSPQPRTVATTQVASRTPNATGNSNANSFGIPRGTCEKDYPKHVSICPNWKRRCAQQTRPKGCDFLARTCESLDFWCYVKEGLNSTWDLCCEGTINPHLIVVSLNSSCHAVGSDHTFNCGKGDNNFDWS